MAMRPTKNIFLRGGVCTVSAQPPLLSILLSIPLVVARPGGGYDLVKLQGGPPSARLPDLTFERTLSCFLLPDPGVP